PVDEGCQVVEVVVVGKRRGLVELLHVEGDVLAAAPLVGKEEERDAAFGREAHPAARAGEICVEGRCARGAEEGHRGKDTCAPRLRYGDAHGARLPGGCSGRKLLSRSGAAGSEPGAGDPLSGHGRATPGRSQRRTARRPPSPGAGGGREAAGAPRLR